MATTTAGPGAIVGQAIAAQTSLVQADTIGACVGAQRMASQIADQAQARIEAARQTNSPPDMRAALDDLQAALARIRGTLAACEALAQAGPAGTHQGHQTGGLPQSPPVSTPEGAAVTITGTISVIHDVHLEITAHDGKRTTVVLDDQTQIFKGTAKATRADLKEGAAVVVDAKGRTLRARTIRLGEKE